MSAPECPRCGTSPIDARTMGDRSPRHVSACTCYPAPPRCISCRRPLDGAECVNVNCPTPFVLQPEPITDPLFSEDYRL